MNDASLSSEVLQKDGLPARKAGDGAKDRKSGPAEGRSPEPAESPRGAVPQDDAGLYMAQVAFIQEEFEKQAAQQREAERQRDEALASERAARQALKAAEKLAGQHSADLEKAKFEIESLRKATAPRPAEGRPAPAAAGRSDDPNAVKDKLRKVETKLLEMAARMASYEVDSQRAAGRRPPEGGSQDAGSQLAV